jgi:aminoglycoside/choline kinase family phosphotransferase
MSDGLAPHSGAFADAVGWPSAQRRAAFERWVAALDPALGLRWATLAPASADASFRRYLRVQTPEGSLIVMDAPPPEAVRPFVHVAGLLQQAALNAPRVLAADEAHGFLLLTDLGEGLYLDALRDADPARADALMRDALQTLLAWQQRVPAAALPAFDGAVLREELALFPEWCVQREFGIQWDERERRLWQQVCDALVASAVAQPVVAVHRDFMPRNLMLCPGQPPGIRDFQDAGAGPLTYDLASLLRDAFIGWDEAQELDWAVRWWQQARDAGLLTGGPGAPGALLAADFGEFWRAAEWMGLQRHLRILGVFCRLKHRDGKPRYAQDLPRFFGYATRVALRYAPLKPLLALLAPMSGQRVDRGFTF